MEKHAPAVKAAMDNLIVPKERWIFAAGCRADDKQIINERLCVQLEPTTFDTFWYYKVDGLPLFGNHMGCFVGLGRKAGWGADFFFVRTVKLGTQKHL